jgi:hypothetical protein
MGELNRRGAVKAVTAAGVGILGASIALADEAKGKEAEPALAFDKPPTTEDVHSYLTTAEAQATLVSAVASFHTNDEDKDWSTVLSIFLNKGARELARVTGITGLYPAHTDNGPFGLSVQGSILKRDLPGGSTRITISPDRHDTWRFNYHLDLAFSDGSHLTYDWPGLVLDENNREMTRIL